MALLCIPVSELFSFAFPIICPFDLLCVVTNTSCYNRLPHWPNQIASIHSNMANEMMEQERGAAIATTTNMANEIMEPERGVAIATTANAAYERMEQERGAAIATTACKPSRLLVCVCACACGFLPTQPTRGWSRRGVLP